MRYFMFMATDPDAPTYRPEEDDIAQWFEEMNRRGVFVDGERLRPLSDATLVRVRDGELLVTDGPFTESKEWVNGYTLIDCADLDEAIEIASKHPVARFGRVEVRPVWPFSMDETPVERDAREGAEKDAGSPVDPNRAR